MERSARVRRSRHSSRLFRHAPYRVPSYHLETQEGQSPNPKKTSLALERRDWEDATCSVCMEFPHNAVLLLCSSHDKGCRPYMCGTSYRHSNCLDQFKKAYTKESVLGENSPSLLGLAGSGSGSGSGGWPMGVVDKPEVMELAACPLCRGQVKGWTVVEPARQYLNNKKRSCMQDGCSFIGTYRELRKHVRSEHPCAKPREVDPALEQKWRRLEHERERQDVISTIRSSMPRSVVFGDYVIEMTNSDIDDAEEDIGGDGEFEAGSRGISRSILYFFLREGARFMRLQRDNHGVTTEGREEAGSDFVAPLLGGAGGADVSGADVSGAYLSGGDDDLTAPDMTRGRGMGILRSERRRRRRRRSRGRSLVDGFS